MLKLFRYAVVPLAFAVTGAVAQDAAPMPDPAPAPSEPPPEPPAPEPPAPEPDAPPPKPVPTPAPTPSEPPAEPPPAAQTGPISPPLAEFVRNYPLCSATVRDSCINPSEAPATKTKTRRRPHRG